MRWPKAEPCKSGARILGNDRRSRWQSTDLAERAPGRPLHGRWSCAPTADSTTSTTGARPLDAFTYEIRDAAGAADTRRSNWRSAPKRGAGARDDVYALNEGAILVEKAPGLLANDRDAENDALR